MRAAVVSAAVLLGAALFNPVHGKDRVPVSQLPPGVYQLDRGHASLTWKVDHLGLSDYTARFATFDAQLTLTPDDLSKSKVEVTVDPASVRTDYPYADQKDFDKKLLMKTAEREKQDKDERIQKKFKVCATLPDDWSLKTEIEIKMPLLKPVEDVSEILNYKDIAHALRYYIYMETQLPKFLQENQSKSIRVVVRL